MQTLRRPNMTVLIVHYHLRAGGVTRVIESQVKVLQDAGHEVIVASSGPTNGLDCRCLLIPELDYRDAGRIPINQLMEVQANLWIVHNPTLGLNVAYPEMIDKAASAGVRMLLQCHDFVEDGRPANYQLLGKRERIYPIGTHIHYATINRRDLGILKTAGIPEHRCHYLPNAVNPPELSRLASEENLVFYPVRGIRRKNLGEFCLLAAHAPEGTRFAVALRSGSEEPPHLHDDWVRFSERLGLPIEFDVAGTSPSSFTSWLERASHLATTSISEGFGLTFLDPAFLGKPLIGRDLPEITRDFIPYGTLYQSIPVPLKHLPGLKDHYREDLIRTMSAYDFAIDDADIEQAWQEFSQGDEVDFGNLPEEDQRHVIKNVHLPALRDWLAEALTQPAGSIDTSPWTLSNYQENLLAIIESVGSPGALDWIPRERLLEQFLHPARFHFLRSKLPDEIPGKRESR